MLGFSWYSDISMRIIVSSSPKYTAATVLASSVLPTPVGPKNSRLTIGRFKSRISARARRKLEATMATASSWSIRRWWMRSSKFSRTSVSAFLVFDKSRGFLQNLNSFLRQIPVMQIPAGQIDDLLNRVVGKKDLIFIFHGAGFGFNDLNRLVAGNFFHVDFFKNIVQRAFIFQITPVIAGGGCRQTKDGIAA